MVAPLPDPRKPFCEQDALVLLSMCLFGEGRNQCREAKIGIGCVIRNRTRLNRSYMGGSTYAGVILHRGQFDCFRPQDPNSPKLLTPLDFEHRSVWEACYEAASQVYQLDVKDVTDGAIFYFSKPVLSPPRAWGAVSMTVQIDGLKFWRELSSTNPLTHAA